eukprot:scaffold50050_cov43-Prasinocladus_malaysianus.AAC.1
MLLNSGESDPSAGLNTIPAAPMPYHATEDSTGLPDNWPAFTPRAYRGSLSCDFSRHEDPELRRVRVEDSPARRLQLLRERMLRLEVVAGRPAGGRHNGSEMKGLEPHSCTRCF